MKIMDIKTPGSAEDGRNRFANLAWLKRRDQIKFVICDRADYDWCRQKLNEYKLSDICEVLFSARAWITGRGGTGRVDTGRSTKRAFADPGA